MKTFKIAVARDCLPTDFPVIALIRALRTACPGLGLKNAKDAIDQIHNTLNTTNTVQWIMTGEQYATFLAEMHGKAFSQDDHIFPSPLIDALAMTCEYHTVADLCDFTDYRADPVPNNPEAA